MMLKRFFLVLIAGSVMMACQVDSSVSSDDTTIASVQLITAEDLPTSSQTYINDKFSGEVVTAAYRVTTPSNVNFEAFLTNSMNLVFAENGSLAGYGTDASLVNCGGGPREMGSGGKGPNGMGPDGHKGPGGPGFHAPDSTGMHPPRPAEITLDSLPSIAVTYIADNYTDSEVQVVLLVLHDDVVEYHVLIAEIGAIIFDVDGNFIELKTRPVNDCGSFEEVGIADLSTSITDFIVSNYPDNEIVKARTGTRNEVVETHVVVDGVGALIFDGDGNFIELKTCGMDKG